VDKCLEMIEKDIEANQPKEEKLNWEGLTNQQLLILLGERLQTGEIKVDKNQEYIYTGSEEINREIIVFLKDGKIKPDPAEEFFKKHGIKK